jgi:TM2 domain-containing membrane protein YozV
MAIKLAIFTGFVGGHHFYMKRIWAGLASVLFCWTFIPLIEGLIEAIFLPQLVRELNEEEAVRIANSINLSRQLNNPGQFAEIQAGPGAPMERVIIKEIIKIPCKYCGSLVENTARSCSQCGGQLQ